MAKIDTRRVTADLEGDFAVFLIGMRINAFWRAHQWLPVFFAMPKMLRELSEQKDLGLLGYRTRWAGRHIETIQYWRSFEQLQAYARGRGGKHLSAWRDFNQKHGNTGAVGIWHETYLVANRRYESIYTNMPTHGLAAATKVVPITARNETAAARLRRSS